MNPPNIFPLGMTPMVVRSTALNAETVGRVSLPEAESLGGMTGARLMANDPEPIVALVCGGSTCPTCGRQTEAIIGPCVGCCESHARTGKFLQWRRSTPDGG